MTKFCTNCGNNLEGNEKTCLYCGANVKGNSEIIDNSYSGTTNQSKSKILAGLLAIFLGSFGVHNFYLGNHSKGTIQILITVVSCFRLSFISELWGIIEGIMILTGHINTDAFGNQLN